MLPVMLDVSRRACVVVGAGPVGARKVRALLDAGATDVRVISPVFDPSVPAGVTRIARRYETGMLAGAGVVFACTNDRAVNDSVVAEARSVGAVVNRADAADEASGDFTTMATLREGPIVVAISGGSAAITAAVKEEIDRTWPRTHAGVASIARELRPVILQSALEPSQRTALLRWLASEEAVSLLRAEGESALRARVEAQLRRAST